MDELIAFWRARLDALEEAAKKFTNPGKMLRDVAADRAILARYERLTQPRTLWERLVYPMLAEVARADIRDRASVWSDHADYRQEWAPNG